MFELRDFGTTAGNTDLFLVIAGANGGSPAGGIGPAIPTGPELELRTGCLNGEFGAVVQNVGDEPSEPTSVTGILERVTVTEVVEETPSDPVVMPNDPVVTPGDPVVTGVSPN